MYRAIIVDDEELVCKGLRKYFDWSEYNIEILGDFPDGQKAYQYVRENPIDLLITDVRMPHMDGITLATHVRELYPDVKIIFVSGYDDVAYLKKALKVDAIDYILKSIDLDELRETVSRVVKIMDAENARKKELADMEELLNQSFPLLQERLLLTLIRDDPEDQANIRERMEFLNIPLDDERSYCVLVLQLQRYYSLYSGMTERERQLISLKIQEECRKIGMKYGEAVCFKSRTSEYVMIISLDEEGYEDKLLQVSEEIQTFIRDYMDGSVYIGISSMFTGLKNIKTAYTNAVNAISNRYLLDDKLPISIDKYVTDSEMKDFREKARKDLLECLSQGDTERIADVLNELFARIGEEFDHNDQQNLMIYLLLLPSGIINDLKVRTENAYSNQRAILEQFLCCKDFHEQCDFIQSMYTQVASLMQNLSKTHSNAIIDQVRRMIEERYKEQISISTLAEEVYLTPTYLCVLFKQTTGSTINEYLTMTRLEKAKQLLADSNIKLYDVCYEVGYLSPSYFSRLFKKYVGISPSEYRNMALSSKN
ncbi:MAG: response regulator [Clostridiaceae bacterium]|nr:response regulator [Clostridiaceae bacterium]